jgi:acetyl-CoA carboxylase beta subunit
MTTKLKEVLQFAAQGETTGNLSLGRGVTAGIPCMVALIENRIASGAIGKAECDKLASLFTIVAAKPMPLVLFLDSAGARVSEGLPALGAFRRMYAAAVKAANAGTPMVAVLGQHCYGGASMLAALCARRVFGSHTRLAMSGPSILAAAAGASALDDTFRAIADVSIGSLGRIKLDPAAHGSADAIAQDVAAPVKADSVQALHATLAARLVMHKLFAKGETGPVTRKDLGLLYPEGYALESRDGVVTGRATTEAGDIAVLGSIDRQPMGAARACRLAETILQFAASPPKALHILLDCDAHSALIDDEKVMLSSYLALVARALAALRAAGTAVETIVLGKAGGGIYVALAAGGEVSLLYGAEVQLLPGKAIQSILGESEAGTVAFADYVAAGVAERERRIGLV